MGAITSILWMDYDLFSHLQQQPLSACLYVAPHLFSFSWFMEQFDIQNYRFWRLGYLYRKRLKITTLLHKSWTGMKAAAKLWMFRSLAPLILNYIKKKHTAKNVAVWIAVEADNQFRWQLTPDNKQFQWWYISLQSITWKNDCINHFEGKILKPHQFPDCKEVSAPKFCSRLQLSIPFTILHIETCNCISSLFNDSKTQ